MINRILEWMKPKWVIIFDFNDGDTAPIVLTAVKAWSVEEAKRAVDYKAFSFVRRHPTGSTYAHLCFKTYKIKI